MLLSHHDHSHKDECSDDNRRASCDDPGSSVILGSSRRWCRSVGNDVNGQLLAKVSTVPLGANFAANVPFLSRGGEGDRVVSTDEWLVQF